MIDEEAWRKTVEDWPRISLAPVDGKPAREVYIDPWVYYQTPPENWKRIQDTIIRRFWRDR